jgi:3-oxo-5-alpha-steroid 4-dehydrogenase 1
MDEITFRFVLFGWILIAVIIFIVLLFIVAPYGRHFRNNFGPSVNAKIGWIIMESPAPLVFAVFFFSDVHTLAGVPVLFLLMWQTHYLDRAFLYPLTIRLSSKPLPISVLVAGIIFNTLNAYLNVYYITTNISKYSISWLSDVRFLLGAGLFLFGFIINRQSDYILYRIRQNTNLEYDIPRDGLYRWVSCPNYLGEILIWFGWTVATWSPVAAAFTLWSIANLVPRARSHHQWYKETFDDYPDKRPILLPWLW